MKEKLPLESLPHFVEEAVADMSREPPYIVANAYHLFTYNGIQVQLVLQEAVNESPTLGDKEILMLSDETSSLVGFGGIIERVNSARLFSEDSEEISDE